MPCEFIVKVDAGGQHTKARACGHDANYYRCDGGVAALYMWLCGLHRSTCERFYHWTLTQVQPPDSKGKGAEGVAPCS